jgi:hypothetical protein
MKQCAFTICAKNYLAQAITLRESFKKHNEEDFYIFLSDAVANEDLKDTSVVELNETWIPKWKEMAFKYNVIEFSTAIKPFCFGKLFSEDYKKVIYLDPDMYVVKDLQFVWNTLDNKSIMLTPHFFEIYDGKFKGAVSDNSILAVGIYNLGYCALADTLNGKKIVTWWKNKLQDQCYDDRDDGTFVDQKWMNFIPAFFPDDVCISHNEGLNVAIWNLHERELIIEDGKYYVKGIHGQKDPLSVFHFSGFDPFNNTVINRRHPQFNITAFPSFKPIIEEYRKAVYENGYKKYHSMMYTFETFNNGEKINGVQRRIFRVYLANGGKYTDPFDVDDVFYQKLKDSNCLTNIHSSRIGIAKSDKEKGNKLQNKILVPLFKVIKRSLGFNRYCLMLRFFNRIRRFEFNYFLLKK